MYPLGVAFGLGFDTSSEIALLGISAVSGAQGTSMWLILLFPVLFTAGMCLLDTTDGALMMSLYTSARLASDKISILYYQAVLTAVTVVVAVVIGTIQFLSMLQGATNLEGGFWNGVIVAGDNYSIIGEFCALFFFLPPFLELALCAETRMFSDHDGLFFFSRSFRWCCMWLLCRLWRSQRHSLQAVAQTVRCQEKCTTDVLR